MGLTVETGSLIPAANSYVTLAIHKAYCLDRGIDLSELTDDEIEAKLVVAASYLDNRYRQSFKGSKVARDQAMAWPREGVDDEDGFPFLITEIPAAVMVAQMELAIRAMTLTLSADIQPSQNIKRRRERIEGVYEEEIEYAEAKSGVAAAAPQFVEIDNILAGLLIAGSDAWELVRG
jgi:hypothetical protein